MFERVRLVSLILVICSIERNVCRNLEQLRYDTAYACEGKTLQLHCKENEVIHLIRANYGRFSITMCNDQGNTDWSVNCMSSKSLRVLHSRCTHQQSCSVQASTAIFTDPCPGTFKYLEAHYKCVPVALSTTTPRPSPPWLLTSQPNVWSTAKISTVRPPILTGLPPRKKPTKPPAKIATTAPLTTTEIPEATTSFDDLTETEDVTKLTTQVMVVSIPNDVEIWNEDEMCPPEYARGLKWNWTKSGEFAVQPCPGGAAGVSRWRCLQGLPPKRPKLPDLSECRSLWLAGLDLRIAEGDAVTSIADDLSQVTDSKPLFGGDLMTTTQIIKKLARKMSSNIQTYPDQRQREAIVTELLQGIVKTSSNLLDASQLASWRDLSHTEQMTVATSLLVGIEENSFLLADTIIREKTVAHAERNVLLHVRILESGNIENELFSCGNNNENSNINNIWKGFDNWLKLDKKSLLENRSEGNLLRIVYAAFDRLEDILVPYSRDNISRIVNSKIVSASLGKGRHIQLSEPVTLCLKHIRVENVSNPSCVFWDYIMSAWSEEGCHVESTNKTHTICVCDHLTNFALLMELNDSNNSNDSLIFSKVIIYTGCVIAIICLFLSICTFVSFQSLKSDRTTIHTNLCICLLVAELLFVFGVNRTEYSILCGIVAGFLHYFFLCSFVWVFFEGFHLYMTFLEVFNVDKSRILWYYLFSYGSPLIVVVISSVIDPYSYGTERYCWLEANNFFIFIFVGPVVAVILANIVFLSMAVYTMCRHASNTVKNEDNRLETAMVWLRGAIVLVFILGLTWTFGLLFLNEESFAIACVFAVFNACQGLFIFIFHCVQNDKVRTEYLRILSRHFDCVDFKEEEVVRTEENKDRQPSLYGVNQNKQQSESSSSSGVVNNANVQQNWNQEDDSHCRTSPRPSTFANLDLPKSSTTWGHLNRPFVWKNSNFDCTKFDEETIKSAAVLSDTLRKSNYSPYACQYPQQLTNGSGRQRKRSRNGSLRPTSPWNHTYTEISEREKERLERRQDDPVYEEIERERNFHRIDPREFNNPDCVRNSSDLSDDEFRRISDMSRQSSKSYGDHRPLIPYSPGTDRNFHSALDAAFRQRLKEQSSKAAQQQSTIAVLDGQTVVCHLQPDYNLRSPPINHLQPYTDC